MFNGRGYAAAVPFIVDAPPFEQRFVQSVDKTAVGGFKYPQL